jgi:hypothetical protein
VDITEVDLKALAAGRIAAQKPSGVRAAHCWFCNKIEAWFLCDCPEAREAQSGKRAKPYFDRKRGTMVLDEEIIKRNLAWGHGRRYEPPPNPVNTQEPTEQAVNKSVNKKPAAVHAKPAIATPLVSVTVHTVDPDAARKAYRREWQRQRRAKQKAPE